MKTMEEIGFEKLLTNIHRRYIQKITNNKSLW